MAGWGPAGGLRGRFVLLVSSETRTTSIGGSIDTRCSATSNDGCSAAFVGGVAVISR